jgi:hypothetical protein
LILHDGEWEPWLPDLEHPLFNEFDGMRMRTIGQEYASQQEVLQAQIEREGRDEFVAGYSALQDESTGRIQTYCVWSQGISSLLPKTDLVFLAAPGDGKVAQVAGGAWEEVRRIAGHLMQAQDVYPERWMVESFPSAEELRQIASMDNT